MKKILALLLATLMLVSLVPMTVFATGTTYTVTNGTPETAKKTNHGYITIDKTTAAAGETVTVTVTPNEGYQLKKLTVLSAISMAPPITPAQDASDKTKYTFKMPGYPVTVTAEFEVFDWIVDEGDNHVWFRITDGVLTIGGEGEIGDPKNYAMVPWYSYVQLFSSVVFLPGVKNVPKYAFYDYDNFTDVKISESVEKIAGYAFYGVTLDALYVKPMTPPTAGGRNTFKNISSTAKFYIPYGTKAAYEAAEYWSDYSSNLVETYYVYAKQAENGTVTVSKDCFTVDTYTTANETVTVTATPDAGYRLVSLKYNDGTDHEITADQDGKYLFTMPKANVTVTAEFEEVFTFNVEFPAGPEQVYIAGDATGWGFVAMEMTSATTATYTSAKSFTEYKYLAGPGWQYVEKAADGSEAGNRAAMHYTDPDVVEKWGEIPHTHGTGTDAVTFDKAWTDATKLPETAGNYYLDTDVTINETWNVPSETTNFCLNGHSIKLAEGNEGSVIKIPENATLNLYDCDGIGKITGGNADGDTGKGGGIYNSGTFTMNGGTIAGCTASGIDSACGGGGVYNDGTLTMNGGAIVGCTAVSNGGGIFNNNIFTMNDGLIQECKTLSTDSRGLGGGVYNNNATFTLSGGTIQKNTASRHGGGIQNAGNGTVIITAGSIINNTAATKGGGAINSDGNVTITGGKIANNTATTEGGGIRFNGNGKTLAIGGTAQITGNTAGAEGSKVTSNVYLLNDKTITIGTDDKAPITTGETVMQVGVTMQTPGKFTTNGTADDAKWFTSDNADYEVIFNTDHLELAKIAAYNYTQKIKYTSLADAISEAVSGDEIELWADENAENVVLPDGVTLYAKSGYTGTVTTNAAGKAVVKQDMFGEYQYKYFVSNVLTITYKDQGDKTFSGTHESGYPTTFMMEMPLELKSASKANYTFGGWFDNADCMGDPITGFYAYTYTDDLTLYAKWICNHTGNRNKVDGQAPTEKAAGFKDYYECDCGKFFEDATGLVPIEDLTVWKAEGGNGYLAKLEEEPTSPQTGDTSNITLWVMLTALSSMGLCACLVLGKKRKNEQ